MDWHGGNLFQILLFQHKHIKIRKRGPFNLLMQIYIHIQYLFFLHSLHRVVQYFKLNVAGLSLIDTIQDFFVQVEHETTYAATFRISLFFHYTMSLADLPKLLRTSVKPVHR